MGRQFDIYLAFPTGGCIPLHPDSYVGAFYLGSQELINGLPFSFILPPLCDQYTHLRGASVHPLAPEGSFRVGLEPTVSGVHGGCLAFLRIECVPDHRSIYPTCSRPRDVQTHTILRECSTTSRLEFGFFENVTADHPASYSCLASWHWGLGL